MAYRKKSQAAHRRVLATRRDAKSPPKGNTRAVRTGAGANGVNLPGFEQTKAEVQAALEHATWIQPCDLLLLDVFTRELHAYRHAADVLARLGDRAIQKKVNATKLQIRRARVLGELADRLGFSPLARSRLGLTVAKTEAIRVQPVRTVDRARAVAELLRRSGALRPVVDADVVASGGDEPEGREANE